MSEHTAGPWYVTASCEDGTMITSGSDSLALWPDGGCTPEAAANARLIAAAPEMLKALRVAAHALSYEPWGHDESLRIVWNAIHKAEQDGVGDLPDTSGCVMIGFDDDDDDIPA